MITIGPGIVLKLDALNLIKISNLTSNYVTAISGSFIISLNVEINQSDVTYLSAATNFPDNYLLDKLYLPLTTTGGTTIIVTNFNAFEPTASGSGTQLSLRVTTPNGKTGTGSSAF